MVPSPALRAGEDKRWRSRDASASEVCAPPRTEKGFAPATQRGSGAPKGASNQMPRSAASCRHEPALRARQRALSGRARLPALCCGSRRGFETLTQLQAMLPGTRVVAGVTRPPLSQSRDSTSRRGRRAAGRDARSRPAPRLFLSNIYLLFKINYLYE
jgi:hypothetical protein